MPAAVLDLLLGPAAEQLWTGFLTARGGRLLRLRPGGAALQPDGGATVRYAADVAWSYGRTTAEVLVAATGSRIPAGATVREAAGPGGSSVPVAVWRCPDDPGLPALAWAARRSGAREHLTALGITAEVRAVRLRSYRPGRRAVVEAVTTAGSFFVKVVPPGAVDRLVAAHAVLAGAVPVPPVLAATDDGAVVLPALPGTPARELLLGRAHGRLPDPAALDGLLDALPQATCRLPRRGRRAPGDALARAGQHAAVLRAVLPALGPRLDALTAVLAAADPGEHPVVPVHGDLYESQLLVDGGAVVGLLDVDTAGGGHRIDDWATVLAHLALLESVAPAARPVTAWRALVERHVLDRWPAGQLRPRVAAVLLGLASGPFRVQQPGWPERTAARVALAEGWARATRALAADDGPCTVTPTAPPSPGRDLSAKAQVRAATRV